MRQLGTDAKNSPPNLYLGLLPQRSTATSRLDWPCCSSHSLALPSRDKQAKVRLMGHSKGRDNAKKRAKRRKKIERLALAKQPSHEATARQEEAQPASTRERETRG
jgi:hypothetical protein